MDRCESDVMFYASEMSMLPMYCMRLLLPRWLDRTMKEGMKFITLKQSHSWTNQWSKSSFKVAQLTS
jgi:hypothetical protein